MSSVCFLAGRQIDPLFVEENGWYTILLAQSYDIGDFVLGVSATSDCFLILREGKDTSATSNVGTAAPFPPVCFTKGIRESMEMTRTLVFAISVTDRVSQIGCWLGTTADSKEVNITPLAIPSDCPEDKELAEVLKSYHSTRKMKSLKNIQFGKRGYFKDKATTFKALEIWAQKHASHISTICETTTKTGRIEKKYKVNKKAVRSAMDFLEELEPIIGRSFEGDMANQPADYPTIESFPDDDFKN